jgi:hypothetical protein
MAKDTKDADGAVDAGVAPPEFTPPLPAGGRAPTRAPPLALKDLHAGRRRPRVQRQHILPRRPHQHLIFLLAQRAVELFALDASVVVPQQRANAVGVAREFWIRHELHRVTLHESVCVCVGVSSSFFSLTVVLFLYLGFSPLF